MIQHEPDDAINRPLRMGHRDNILGIVAMALMAVSAIWRIFAG